ncbi:exodeoxyribonuclease VII small subunit [Candidatus Saccharibacteria bacterium]|nr:exodeoxyribonuclease VII small subunit [Candidatus Saccharibacteria bacterium]
MSEKEQIKEVGANISEKISKLDEKIKWFYSDEFSLDEASSRYKEAVKLAEEIEDNLENLKNDIKVLGHDFTK